VIRLLLVILILLMGAAVLAPAISFFNPEPLPGDFIFSWASTRFVVPVLYSLCASVALALLYLVMKR
jgi:Protein of unknown function (DUF2905)